MPRPFRFGVVAAYAPRMPPDMAITAWGLLTGWIDVAPLSLLLIAPLGTAFIEPRRRVIERLAQETPERSLPQSLERSIHDPVLVTVLQTVTILLLGIVFLMTNKPSLTGSLIVMTVALVLGLASGALVSRVTVLRGQNIAEPVGYQRDSKFIEGGIVA